MKAFRDYMQHASLGVHFAWFTGFFFLGTYGFALLDGTSKLNLGSAFIRLVGALFFGGIMTVVVARQRRRDGGTQTAMRINAAMKAGTVPEDAEPSIWVPALEARRKQNERTKWMNPTVFGLFTLLGIWLIVEDPTSVLSWLVEAFFVSIAIVSVIQARKTVSRIDALLDQIRGGLGRRKP